MLFIAGWFIFGALVTLNSGGYRYGATDQAFYIPVILQQITPDLFPHDGDLIAAQDRFFLFDDWFAPILHVTGISLPTAFLVAYLFTLTLLYAALLAIGRAFNQTWWAVGGFVILATVRHQIPDTAVNSVEGYFHPRMLAFAVGLSAVAVFLRGRTRLSLAVVCLTLLAHPTTGLWFVILIGGAVAVSEWPGLRAALPWFAAATATSLWALAFPLRERLAVMDTEWIGLLAIKNYLVVPGWPLEAWLSNLAIAVFVFAVYGYRRALGAATRREGGVVAGCAALVGVFLISAPFSHALLALAVQLQFNRVFWLVDIIGVAYLGWLLCESPLWTRAPAQLRRVTPRRAVVIVLALLSLTRGGYRVFVERAGQPVIQIQFADGDWTDLMHWAAGRPVGTYFLADPGHAGRYGTSVRAASGRDVYLEIMKDTGIAIYSSDIAHRVGERIADLGDFDSLDAAGARSLADRYAIDFLITERRLDLPVAHEAGRFIAYALNGL